MADDRISKAWAKAKKAESDLAHAVNDAQGAGDKQAITPLKHAQAEVADIARQLEQMKDQPGDEDGGNEG